MVHVTYFVHGTTTDNEQHLATGWLPGELSELGVQQTMKLAEQIGGQSFDAIFASDLKRAVDSAHILFGEDRQLVQDARLREANYGTLSGGPHSFKDNMEQYINTPFPGGESYKDVEQRIRDFCQDLKKTHDGQHIAIVAHQAPQLALDVVCRGRTWEQAIAEDWRKTKAFQPGWEYQI